MCTSVKNTVVHAETLNIFTEIKLSDTDNVVVGTDINLVIAGDIYRTIQPSQRLPQRQYINYKKNDI